MISLGPNGPDFNVRESALISIMGIDGIHWGVK